MLGIADDRAATDLARLHEASADDRARIVADYRTSSAEAIDHQNQAPRTVPSPNA